MQHIWRATVERVLARVDSAVERKRIRESFRRPIVRRAGRETLMYYDHGRSTDIGCDFAIGSDSVDLLVYKEEPLKWHQTGELLTPEESAKVHSTLVHYLAGKNLRWAYSETIYRTRREGASPTE